MNRLFYVVYNSYYKNGEYENDIPSLTVGGIFLIFLSSIVKSISIIIGWVNPVYSKIKFDKLTLLLFLILYGIIVYLLFYHKKRYLTIYQKYKDNTFLNSKLAKRLGFFIVILVIISPIILVMIQTKIHYGWWIKFS